MKISSIISLVLIIIMLTLISGCVGIGGEQIDLSHDPLTIPSERYSEKIAFQKPAEDIRRKKQRIGRATVTLFAITSGSVTTTTPIEDQLVDQIKDALGSLGYQVDFVSARNPAIGQMKEIVEVIGQMKETLISLGYDVN